MARRDLAMRSRGARGLCLCLTPGAGLDAQAMYMRYFSEMPVDFEQVKTAVSGDPTTWIPGAARGRGGEIVTAVGAPGPGAVHKEVRLALGRVEEGDGRLRVPISWRATGPGFLFPRMDGDVELSRWNNRETLLCLQVDYTPPLGAVGRVVDQRLLHGLAMATLAAFRDGITGSLARAASGEGATGLGPTIGAVLGIGPAVADIMTREVHVVSPGSSLLDAAALMREKRVSGLPVVEGRNVVGFISERDIVRAFAPPAARRRRGSVFDALVVAPQAIDSRAASRRVQEVMSKKVVSVRPEDSAWAAARLLERKGFRALPVTGALDRLAGIVARADFLRLMAPADPELRRRVRQALAGLNLAAAGRITCTVSGGDVTLAGTTRSLGFKVGAVELVRQVPGVRSVLDEISYITPNPPRALARTGAPGPGASGS